MTLNHKQFIPIKNGVKIIHPCGSIQIIMNSWYVDIQIQ